MIGQIQNSSQRRRVSAHRYLAPVALTLFALAAMAQTVAPGRKPYLVEEVDQYSKTHAVVVIGVAKGQKEPELTGEEIGESLTQIMKKKYDVPVKYFVEPGGDYSTVIFSVNGHMYGPYALKDSIEATALVADAFNVRVRSKGSPAH